MRRLAGVGRVTGFVAVLGDLNRRESMLSGLKMWNRMLPASFKSQIPFPCESPGDASGSPQDLQVNVSPSSSSLVSESSMEE